MHVRLAHGAEGDLAAGTAELAGDARPHPPTGTDDDGWLGTGTERIGAATAADEAVAIPKSPETDA